MNAMDLCCTWFPLAGRFTLCYFGPVYVSCSVVVANAAKVRAHNKAQPEPPADSDGGVVVLSRYLSFAEKYSLKKRWPPLYLGLLMGNSYLNKDVAKP